MIKLFLGIFGLLCLIQIPVIGIIALINIVALYIYKPRSFPSNRTKPASSLRTGNSSTSSDKGFTTMKEKQDKWVKELIRPDWDPWSPENRARTQAIHDVMDRNRRQAQREMADEILREKAEKARKEELGQS